MNPLTVEQIKLFMLMFVRLTAMLFLLPIFGHSVIQSKYRIGLAFFLTIIIFPLMGELPVPEVSSLFPFAWLLIKEVAIGLVIGYFTLFLFGAVSFAGSILDMQMGFAMLQLPDPIAEKNMSTASGFLFSLIFTIAFLLFNGHYFLLLAVKKSFVLIPPGYAVFPAEAIADSAVLAITHLVEIALRLSAPVLVVMIITSASLGIIAKTMPQMNIFFVGMPLKIGTGFLAIMVSLPSLINLFESVLHQLYKDIWILLKAMAV